MSYCSLRSLRIAPGSRLLRRRSPTKGVSAHSSSARRRAIRNVLLLAPLAPLAADRAGKPPTSSSLAYKRRVGSLLLSTPARDPQCLLLAPLARIAPGSRLLRRRSPTKGVSAHSSSARRRAIRNVSLLAPLAADRAGKPPTSSSLADKRRVGSLLLSTPARDPLFDCSLRSRGSRFGSRCLPLSLADEKRVCSFVRPGQRRAILGALHPIWVSQSGCIRSPGVSPLV